MKKHIIFFAAAALCVLAASCSKEIKDNSNSNIDIPAGFRAVNFAACGENVKTALQDDKTIEWEAGDEIIIYWGTEPDQNATATATASGAETTFSLVAIPEECEKVYAVYPAAANSSLDAEGAVSITIPDEQQGGFAGSNYAVATASAEENSWDGVSLQFKNVASFLKVEVTDTDITKVVFTAVGGKAMTGELKATFDGDGEISVDVPEVFGNSVALNIAGTGEYYAAVIPGVEYDQGVLVDFYKDEQKLPSYYYRASVTTTRAKILSFSTLDTRIGDYYVSPEGSGTKSGKNVENSMDIAAFKDFIAQKSDSDESAAQAAQLSGSTVHFAAGIYDFDELVNIGFEDDAPEVGLKFEGVNTELDSTVFTGAKTHQILNIAEGNVNLDIKDIVFYQSATDSEQGSAISIDAASTSVLTVEGCNFSDNKATNGGALYVGANSNVTLKDCKFTGNSATNGASIYTKGKGISVKATNCTFDNGVATRFGGAVCILGGTHEYNGCTFNKCSYSGEGYDSKTDVKFGGGAIYQESGNQLTLTKCEFKNCFGKTDKTGAAICLGYSGTNTNGGVVDVQECTFDGNEGTSGTVFYLNSASGLLRVNNSKFKNNTCGSRGLIRMDGKSAVFFNNCSFYQNKTKGQWGHILHADQPSVACFNNCTIHDNNPTNSTQSDHVCLHQGGYLVVTNSTIVNSNGLCLLRNDKDTGKQILVANSILLNTYKTSGKVFDKGNMKATCKTYNCYLGQTSDETFTTGKWDSTNDKKYIAALAGGHFDDVNLVYLWDGPSVEDEFTKAKETEVLGYLNAMTTNNGNTKINGAFGPAFATWVESKGGFAKDALGKTRTAGGTWPGAIEN